MRDHDWQGWRMQSRGGVRACAFPRTACALRSCFNSSPSCPSSALWPAQPSLSLASHSSIASPPPPPPLPLQLRLHLQMLNSLLIYIVALSLMSIYPGDSAARQRISPGYLSLHLLITALGPICYTALGDFSNRLAFQTQLREQLLKSFPLLKLQPAVGHTHAPAPAAALEPAH